MNILIVDDSKAMRMIVKRTLRQAGFGDHQVQEAANGLEALDIIQEKKPSLVLCDWNMPEMSGIELLNALAEKEISVRFGFVTSEATPQIRETAMEAGALFLITKPFTAECFQSTLSSYLS